MLLVSVLVCASKFHFYGSGQVSGVPNGVAAVVVCLGRDSRR